MTVLRLLGTAPGWVQDDGLRPLPDNLPGWTLAYLALASDWVPRERLCALLWPQAAAAEAQHSLRMNLHRMRGVLAAFGAQAALEADRRRVRLALPTDVAQLPSADGEAPVPPYPGALLDGFTCDGFPALAEWLQLERTALANRWREAAVARLARLDDGADEAVALAQQMLAVDVLDETALGRLLVGLRAQDRGEEADRHYAAYRERLARELGAEPSPAIRALASGAARAAERGAMPPPAFVGRKVELAELASKLARGARLVTIVGPGGVGKSALARELATHSAQPVPWIDLQDLADLDAAAARIAQRLGAPLRDGEDAVAQLGRALGATPRLLVLDNAEHLLPALAEFVARLLAAAPALKVLATSRTPLAAAGETVYPLTGLALPDEDSRDAEAAQAFDAVRLFALRAQAARADFDLARHVEAVIAIAEAVDGLPLALELAAGWVRWLTPAAIARELQASLAVLQREPRAEALPARPEHRSMQAVLERTWSLLAADERAALEALSVFEGGFTRAAAEAVADAPLPVLSALADRGLVRVDAEGRFDLHPLVQEHARRRLAADPAREATARERHAAYFAAALAATFAAHPNDDRTIAGALLAEMSNARRAWQHALASGQHDHVLRMTPVWRRYFEVEGRYEEACRHFDAADRDGVPPGTRAAAYLRINRAHFLVRRHAPSLALPLALDAHRDAEAIGDPTLSASCTSTLGGCAMALGRFDEAAQWFGRTFESNRQIGDRAGQAAALNSLSLAHHYAGRFADALSEVDRALSLYRQLGHVAGIARALINKAQMHLANDALGAPTEQAARAADAALEAMHHASGHKLAQMRLMSHFYLGLASLAQGDFSAARDQFRLCGERGRERGDELFLFKAHYHIAYLDCIGAKGGGAEAGALALLAAAATAHERGYDEDLLYIALFVAQVLRGSGFASAAARLAASVRDTPQPPSDAVLHAHALRLLATVPPAAGRSLPFETFTRLLAASGSTAELARRLEAQRGD